MRVITGTARGRNLLTLPGEDVRPTTDRVKEVKYALKEETLVEFDSEALLNKYR